MARIKLVLQASSLVEVLVASVILSIIIVLSLSWFEMLQKPNNLYPSLTTELFFYRQFHALSMKEPSILTDSMIASDLRQIQSEEEEQMNVGIKVIERIQSP